MNYTSNGYHGIEAGNDVDVDVFFNARQLKTFGHSGANDIAFHHLPGLFKYYIVQLGGWPTHLRSFIRPYG